MAAVRRRDDYSQGPNLAVLVPVLVILGTVAILFFGWLGIPWAKIRARRAAPRTAKDGIELSLRSRATASASTLTPGIEHEPVSHPAPAHLPSGARVPDPSRPEPVPGSGLSYAMAYDRSRIDCLKLPVVDARNKTHPYREHQDAALALQGANFATAASGEATPARESTLDVAHGTWDAVGRER